MPGRTFDGLGAISGGGGNSRLLIDYPPRERARILDLLFKPDVGASLQLLKVEIGGGTNTTDGAEPSAEPQRGDVDCDAGYEWWLMREAKARNPAIRLYGLAWGAPGWVGEGRHTFFTASAVRYVLDWLGCARSHGLRIDYLGGWNERGYDRRWYVALRAALDAAGYGSVELVAGDGGWAVAGALLDDPAFAAAVDIVGVHYPCSGGIGGDAASCRSPADAAAVGEAAVGERERRPAARHRRRRDGAVDQPRLPRRRPDRLPRVAGPRGPLPEPPLRGRRSDSRERAVVGQLRRRLPAVDRRAVDAVRRAGLAVSSTAPAARSTATSRRERT